MINNAIYALLYNNIESFVYRISEIGLGSRIVQVLEKKRGN
jgi:hypothetical protein